MLDPFLLTRISLISPSDISRDGRSPCLSKFVRGLELPVQHVLVIDWDLRYASSTGSSLCSDAPDVYLDFLGRLHDIVEMDMARPETERIDYVLFEWTDELEPSRMLWQALDGLRPKYLEVVCGQWEEFEIRNMDELSLKWPLKALIVEALVGEAISSSESPYLETLETLVLDHTCNLQFQPTRITALQNLVIIQNDACSTFVSLQECGFLGKLQTAIIRCTSGLDSGNMSMRFLPALRQCPLKSLTLWIAERLDHRLHSHSEVDDPELAIMIPHLPHFLPSGLETLHVRMFHCQIGDLSVWRECVEDLAWLPQLKVISLAFEHNVAADASTTLATGDLALLNTLAEKRPSVTIAPRSPEL